MAFFDQPFFEEPHFKSPFYGEDFFQVPFFDDTTLAHGQTGGTTSSTSITIVCNRDITGTNTPDLFIVTVDGTANIVTAAVGTLTDLVLTVTTPILTGTDIRVSYDGESTNNIGILDNEPIVNNEV